MTRKLASATSRITRLTPAGGRLPLLLLIGGLLAVCVVGCGGFSGRTIPLNSVPPPQDPESRLEAIQTEVFTPMCATADCHVEGGSSPMPLTDARTSYAALVGVAPENSKARAAGRLLVAPGDPDRSFLLHKLNGDLQFGEGDRMPSSADTLTPAQIARIQAWIAQGATLP